MPPSGMRWYGDGLPGLEANLAGRGTGGREIIKTILGDIADEAVTRMRKTVMTTPSALSPGKGNRYWSGDMYHNIVRGEVEVTGTKVSVEFGWPFGYEDYFLYQDWGVDPKGKRPPIPPMHALLGTFIWAREEAKQRISDMRLK